MAYARKKRGFTLVEMIIYIAFFALLSSLAVNATLVVMRSFYSLRLTQSINESATTALERMSREIRNAYDYDITQSIFNANPGQLTLKTKDASGANTTIKFYLNPGNQLILNQGGVDQGSLVTKDVTLTKLIFRPLTTINSKSIKIEATFQDTRDLTTQTVNFYDTILLRGSEH